jgi:tRNA isopentenyl-2-thiomethyl-A-37 hydroxylase MiaE
MSTPVRNLTLLSIVLAGYAAFVTFGVHAEPQPVIDRLVVDRLIRAQEQQARALDNLVRVSERCKH